MTADSILATLRRASQRTLATLCWVARGIVWLAAPVITSTKGALDREDVRHAIVKAVGASGLTWSSFRAALHDPTVMDALLSIGIGIFAFAEALLSRHMNGVAPAPALTPPPPTITSTVNVNIAPPEATPTVPPPPTPAEGPPS